ncbi:Transcription initiation factor TFIID subunit 12 [Linum grandiflorum]
MEQLNPATPSTVPPPATTATVSQPTDPSPVRPPPQQSQIPVNIQQQNLPQQQQSAPQPPSVSAPAPVPATTPTPTPNPNPNPNPNPPPRPSTPLVQPQSQSNTVTSTAPRPHRPWQHPHPHTHFQHFSSPSPPTPVPSLSSAASAPISTQQQRGGIAIGIPAAHPSTFSQPFGGLNRGPVNVPESAANSTASQVRHGMQGIHGVGVMGSIGSSSQMRPGAIPAHQQQRPFQSSIRPPTSSTQAPNTQNFQGHSFMRPSGGLPGSSAPNTSQGMQPSNQPWLSSGAQAKPPIPPPSYRAQIGTQSLQQRPHALQQHSALANTPQQHTPTAQTQQSLTTQAAGEQHGQQVPSARVAQPLPHPQQTPRVPASINQKHPVQGVQQPAALQTVSKAANAVNDETSSRILSKRSIQDLVGQIDPSERLDPDVEDILADIADEFVESITTFGCSLAKHRKSDTLEAKDILLHLEKNWNITLPGFSGDEIKTYRKPPTNDVHKERLAAIRKSVSVSETGTGRNVGQAPGSGKSNLAKTPVNPMVSPPNLTKTN